MAYSNNIPQATDRPNNSQPLILANFAAIDTVVGINHVVFDDPSGDQGKHKYISFPVQTGTPPTPPFVSGEPGMYSFANVATGQNEINIVKLNQATDTIIPMTASILSITSAPAANSAGWSMLPSGILIKWGFGSANGISTITYDATVAFGAVFSVTVSSNHGGGTNDHLLTVYSSGTASFQARSTKASAPATSVATGVYYFAVGRPV